MKRREFLAGATAAAALAKSGSAKGMQAGGVTSAQSEQPNSSQAAARIPRVTHPGTMKGEMLYRQLGTTGEQVSVIGLGGSHLGKANVQEEEASSMKASIAASTFSTTRGTTTKAAAKNVLARPSRRAAIARKPS